LALTSLASAAAPLLKLWGNPTAKAVVVAIAVISVRGIKNFFGPNLFVLENGGGEAGLSNSLMRFSSSASFLATLIYSQV